jgi:hypothetical protein
MAPKKTVKVTLSTPQVKKLVTRFDSPDEKAALSNVYVSNDALKTLGNPDSIVVTITAA